MKRYDIYCDETEESPDGEWVRWSDVAAQAAAIEREALRICRSQLAAANARADAAERRAAEETVTHDQLLLEVSSYRSGMQRAESEAATLRAEVEAERAHGYFWKLAEDRLAQLAAKEQQRAELEEHCRSMAEWRDKLRNEADAANARADAAERHLERHRQEDPHDLLAAQRRVADLDSQCRALSEDRALLRDLVSAVRKILPREFTYNGRFQPAPVWFEEVNLRLDAGPHAPTRSEPRLATLEETAKQAAWEQSTWTNAQRTDHERALLEACRELTEEQILQIHSIDSELGNALLARREESGANAQRTDHERAVLEAMRNARIEQCGSVRRFMSELQEDAVCRAELARREAEKQ